MKKIHLILILFSIVSCTDDTNKSSCEQSLPPSTTRGANTFGACVNGKLLIPRSGGGSFGTTPSAARVLGGWPEITDYDEIEIRDLKGTRTSYMLLHIHNVYVNGLGNYIINQSNGLNSLDGLNHTYLHCRVLDDKTGQYQYYRSFEESGIIEITRNEYPQFMSGTFNGQVVNSANPADTIHIKQGRFDLNLRTLPNISFP